MVGKLKVKREPEILYFDCYLFSTSTTWVSYYFFFMVQFTELKYIEMWTDQFFANTWMCLMTLKNSWSGYTWKHDELLFL